MVMLPQKSGCTSYVQKVVKMAYRKPNNTFSILKPVLRFKETQQESKQTNKTKEKPVTTELDMIATFTSSAVGTGNVCNTF